MISSGLIGVRLYLIFYREANRCVDYLAKQGLDAPLDWVLPDVVNPMLGILIADDIRGCSLPWLVV